MTETIEHLIKQVVSHNPRKKILKLEKILSYRINSPVFDLSFPEKSCNSSILLSILSCVIDGKMLLFGPSGTGKSTIVESAAQLVFGDLLQTLQAATIHGHSQINIKDLEEAVLPSGPEDEKFSITGVKKDLSQISIIFIDDLSGMGEGAQTILNTLLEERIIVRKNTSYTVQVKPVFATSNRLTSADDRSRALLDRFHIATIPTGLNPEWLGSLTSGREFGTESGCGFQLHEDDIKEIKKQIDEIRIDPGILSLMEFFLAELSHCELISTDARFKSKACAYLEEDGSIERLCSGCPLRQKNNNLICSETNNSISTRALEGLILYLKSITWFLGRESVDTPELVEEIIPFVFLHRLTPSSFARKESLNTSNRILWIRELWRRSMRTYRYNEEKIDNYRYVLATLMNRDLEKKMRDNLIESARKGLEAIESPGKYAFINSLNSRILV